MRAEGRAGAPARASTATIDRAWEQISRRPDPPYARHGYTGARIERAIQIIVAVGTGIMGVQSAIFTINDRTAGWGWLPVIVLLFASMAAMIVACLLGRGARVACGIFACLFPAVLIAWAAIDPPLGISPERQPWPYFLLAIATVAAIVAFTLAWQIVSAIGVPVVFAVGRILHGDGAREYWIPVAYDVSIALLLGIAFVLVAWLLRGIAAGVDDARAEALSAYSDATSIESAERERVEVATLMHDSVLAALIAVSRAESDRERELAVSMARDALGRLANAEDEMVIGTNEPVSVVRVTHEVREAVAQLGVDIDVGMPTGAGVEIPARAARALVLATTQAVANAIEHADAAGLAVDIDTRGGGVRITVRDSGPGFDLDAISADRLGIRGSIVARIAAAGGRAKIEPSRSGTTVTLDYERQDDQAGRSR
ncbi:sensor histidine kinase [Microbacterium karelineae]|uniref:sensor histidine kinase n=1 Tax=Microbacterium karelineae TaxID=2654283 RepID=UPI0012E9CDE0|nr:ATP-binding protein [Microbacterium karelineae]